MTDNKDKTELYTALNEFQTELVKVGKKADNPYFRSKYADLASIMLATQPVLTKYGLAVIQLLTTQDGKPALRTMVVHKSGQAEESTIEMALAKNDPQGVGSAITYYRRYAYAAALQIVIDEDDDGNKASQPAKSQTAPKPASKRPWENYKPETANPAQKAAIKRHLDKLGIEPEHMNDYLTKMYNVVPPLTKESAAAVLDMMITEDDK